MNQPIVKPGDVPPFPPLAGGDLSKSEQAKVADAAWARSGGSIQAFEQLCAEHVRGEIDLLGGDPGDENDAAGADGGEAAPVRGKRKAR
jgi:hypothetical protein